ncbi:MAG: ATP synthase F1 subunit epsilon, partial [Deltaproteobacteria bacterium]|nr:ATP synthase F1 subunit epsilon [Deltaproteobacteria bacterium]
MNLILDVVTPLGAKLSREEATSLTLPGVIGEMGILAGHTPLMAALKIGRMTVQRGKKEKVFAI